MKEGCVNIVGKAVMEEIFKNPSSNVTDGTSLNSGDKNGLWELFDKREERSNSEVPLLKTWCAAHRTNLAWKITTNCISELNHLLRELSSICSFFHVSAVRTRELKSLAEQHNLTVITFPAVHEIRWCEFTHT